MGETEDVFRAVTDHGDLRFYLFNKGDAAGTVYVVELINRYNFLYRHQTSHDVGSLLNNASRGIPCPPTRSARIWG